MTKVQEGRIEWRCLRSYLGHQEFKSFYPSWIKQQATFPSMGVARALLEQQVPTVR